MEITFDDRTAMDGKILVRIRFAEIISERYFSADVGVWVPDNDSWASTQELAVKEAIAFLNLVTSKFSQTVPPQIESALA